jgi:Domain of unknown function (DUF4260)
MTTSSTPSISGVSMPNILLRLEGLAVLAAALILYAHLRGNAWLFVALILAPDLSMIGYLVNTRLGSLTYNTVHTYTLPALVLGAGLAANIPTVLFLGLIWFAHIGADRLLGYGLKYPNAFKDTHMQHV